MGALYDQDFVGWTEQQARALRELAKTSNAPLDWDNLAEEVESLGRSHLGAVGSQIRRIVLHLLKLEFSPAQPPRNGWMESVSDARAEIESVLDTDPGLRPRLPELIARESRRAENQAVSALRAYGEDTSAILARQRAGAIYTQAQILEDGWFPEPARPP